MKERVVKSFQWVVVVATVMVIGLEVGENEFKENEKLNNIYFLSSNLNCLKIFDVATYFGLRMGENGNKEKKNVSRAIHFLQIFSNRWLVT